MIVEEKEDRKQWLKAQLKAKVRPHRPAPKVLEIAIAMTEDRIEQLEEETTNLEWELEYIRGLDAAEIEEELKES